MFPFLLLRSNGYLWKTCSRLLDCTTMGVRFAVHLIGNNRVSLITYAIRNISYANLYLLFDLFG